MLVKRKNRPANTVIHCGYHKCMTVYFTRMLRTAARRTGRAFHSTVDTPPDALTTPAFILDHESRLDLDRFGDYRCTHIIRDPRDLLVSGYFYHLRTDEPWCIHPLPGHPELPEDVSYQAHLQSLPKEEGMLFELRHVSGTMTRAMHAWDYSNPRVLELRYESLLGHEREWFRKIFDWYGLKQRLAGKMAKVAERHSLDAIRRKANNDTAGHIRRNTRIGQWQDHFTDRVKAAFKEQYGQTLIDLGYERNFSW